MKGVKFLRGRFLRVKDSKKKSFSKVSVEKSYQTFFSWFLVYTFLIGILTFFIQSTNVSWEDFIFQKKIGVFFYFIFRFLSHQIFLALITALPLFILIRVIFVYFLKKKKFFLSTFVTLVFLYQTLFLLLSISDTYVFRLYRIRLDINSLFIFSLIDFTSIIEFLKHSGDLVLSLLVYAFGILISLVLAVWVWKKRLKMNLKLGLSFLVIYGLCQFVHLISNLYHYPSIVSNEKYLQHFLFEPKIMKVWNRMVYRNLRLPAIESMKISMFSRRSLKYPRNEMKCNRTSPPLNIFFIVLDSIRFDMLNKEVMPNVFSWSQKNIKYLHHYSTGNDSIFGLFGLFYGLPSIYHNPMERSKTRSVFVNEMLSREYLIDLYLYWTYRSTNLRRTALNRLKENKDPLRVFTHQASTPWETDQKIVDIFLSQLKKKSKEKSYFNLLFLGAAHDFSAPFPEKSKFQPIAPFFRRLKLSARTPVEPLLNLYKSSVFFMDQLVGKVLKALEEGGWMENSVVIVTADHGQEVNQLGRGEWEHLSNFSDWQIRVPFVLSWPKRKSKTFHRVTSHIDVVPTLMQNLFECENPISDYSRGKNLFDEDEKKRYLMVLWLKQALLTGKEVYSFEEGTVKVFDSLTYKEKENSLEDLSFLSDLIEEYKKQFF